jgi:hypothetical protein
MFGESRLLTTGMFFLSRWLKSTSLKQLSLEDNDDPRQTFVYRLSQQRVLQYFKHVLVFASPEDKYVPYHSARIEHHVSTESDPVWGPIYAEMVENILRPLHSSTADSSHPSSNSSAFSNSSSQLSYKAPQFSRIDVSFVSRKRFDSLIGRAAHICFLDQPNYIWALVSLWTRYLE